MNDKINAAVLQFMPVIADVEGNFAQVEKLLKQLKPEIDLVVLPELAFTGYNFATRQDILPFAESTDSSKTLKFLYTQAQKHGIYIVAGFPEYCGFSVSEIDNTQKHLIYNSSMLVGAEGLVGTYRKIHLFGNEKNIFDAGEKFEVFDIKLPNSGINLKLGILVCFDWIFPESWLILFHKGADVIAHCTNLVLPGRAQKAIPAISMMHRIPVILANRFGTEAQFPESAEDFELTFTGNSIISDAFGNVLASAPESTDFIGYATINLKHSRDKQITEQNNLFTDRKPELYRDNGIVSDS
ncbi:MAG: carbon-nitrogen hydrolase [Planctomycetes bacterium]|nr:carbon-nitrogen hydrolase [Planctomycetota bacterium]